MAVDLLESPEQVNERAKVNAVNCLQRTIGQGLRETKLQLDQRRAPPVD